jgi:hypothetical protein
LFCKTKFNWDETKIKRTLQPALSPINKSSSSGGQRRIDDYFVRYQDSNVSGVVQSERLKYALSGMKRKINIDGKREEEESNSSSSKKRKIK